MYAGVVQKDVIDGKELDCFDNFLNYNLSNMECCIYPVLPVIWSP